MRKPTDYYKNPPPADFSGLPKFKNPSEGYAWIAKNRWGKKPKCPDCRHKTTERRNRNNGIVDYLCTNEKCKRTSFTALTGTALERTQLPIHFWLFAAREFNKAHAGLSTRGLEKALHVPIPTAVRMYQLLGKLYLAKQGHILGDFAPKHADTGKHSKYGRKPAPSDKNEVLHIPKPVKPKRLTEQWGFSNNPKVIPGPTITDEELSNKFDEETAIQFFVDLRWRDGLTCPDCGSSHCGEESRTGHFRCYNKDCSREHFNYKTHTPMMHSNLSAKDWILSMNEMMLARQGSSCIEYMNRRNRMGKRRYSYDTIFYMMHRLRLMMASKPDGSAVGPLEVDEVFVKDNSKKKKKGHFRTRSKTIIGARCRTTGKIFVEMISNLTGESMLDFVNRCCGGRKITVFTDGHPGYKDTLSRYGHHHEYAEHSKGEYAKPSAWKIINDQADAADAKAGERKKNGRSKNVVHSNSVESMWRQLRAALVGVYRKISTKYLMWYMAEVAFRLDKGRCSIDMGTRIAYMYLNGMGKSTTYSRMASS